MRLMQRLAVSGLLTVILIVLLTGTFVTRRDLANIVERGVAPEERNAQQLNPPWVQSNVIPGQDEVKPEDTDRRIDFRHRQSELSAVGPPPAPVPGPYVIKPPSPPLDDVTNQRREKIKEMMKHGWDNYVRYAWGKNELKPISKRGHSASIFGAANMGATIVDGLDTLYIMGLHEEFKQGRDWIAENLDFDIGVSISGPDITFEELLSSIGSCSPMIIFIVRYVSFILNFPVVKLYIECTEMEETTLKDSEELAIFMKCIADSSRLIAIYLYLAAAAVLLFTGILFSPIILDLVLPLDEVRGRLIYYMSPIFTDRTSYVDLITVQCWITFTAVLVGLACTESVLVIITHYLCPLLKITSYRMRNAIVNGTNYELHTSSKQIKATRYEIRLVANVHNRALVSLDAMLDVMTIPYLTASLLVVISFAFNLHRFVSALETRNDATELAVSLMIVSEHVKYMFLNNYCGQMVIDDSLSISETTYNSTWYLLPISTQKLILFSMMKTAIPCELNLSGLFTPCYVGFSTMMSTSFSYFTMMYSLREN